ncbi:MAG: Cys-tRNA(Pro) deacylase [Symbiobacterium sp.]|uniref:Cys-tRNA(Pro) deacylase n=1 Tax=Symbiobacterium sp. TaxID=1971213 RepID=UPI003463B378
MKSIAARILDQLGVSYELREYEWSEEELDAVSVARKIGLPPEQVFKTLVVRGDRTGVMVASIPGNAELDLKKLAAISGNKKVEMVHVREIQGLTGYVRGGVSPLGMKKHYPYYLDETAEIIDRLAVSAGQRGLQLVLSGPDLIRATGAKLAALTR